MTDEVFMEDFDGIIDDDPALDVIMIDEMEKEHNRKRHQNVENGGCLSVIVLVFIPVLFIL